mmetsp:Transcript_22677/g.52399  ORF Transcript_22677/g.52399 Transcript_22677/m.52399 type:complete len:91 (+) Transcript_22677:319-591(+)
MMGSIPPSFGVTLNRLEVLSLSHNSQLGGTIPTQLADLQRLHVLDLNHTNITGSVPEGVCILTDPDTTRVDQLEVLTVDCTKVACDCCDC